MPVEKLTDNAYEVVMAARFGRMDIVTAMVRPDLRAEYAEAHSSGGGRSRILDIEYSGMRLIQSDKAIVAMTVSWQRLDESMLRTTALAQTWERGEGGWLIVDEAFAGGDKGLLDQARAQAHEARRTTGVARERGLRRKQVRRRSPRRRRRLRRPDRAATTSSTTSSAPFFAAARRLMRSFFFA